MQRPLIVITSASEFERDPIDRFLFKRDRNIKPRYISHIYADAVLARDDDYTLRRGERFAVLDQLQTRATYMAHALRCHDRALVVPIVHAEPEDDDYWGWEEFALRARATVVGWGLFSVVDLACLTLTNRMIDSEVYNDKRRQDSS